MTGFSTLSLADEDDDPEGADEGDWEGADDVDADALGLALGDGDASAEADGVYAGRLPTDSTVASSTVCHCTVPMYRTTATPTARLAQKTTSAERDLFTS
jgi:hypothetical protein